MGKYKHEIVESKQDKIMLNTLNELAETNRLYRLKNKPSSYAMETPMFEIEQIEKDWSDQA